MSVQPHLPFAAPPTAPAERSDVSSSVNPVRMAGTQSPPAPVWLQRLSLGVLVIFCLYLGLLIAILPWWKDMWDRNALLLQHPALRSVLIKGPVRGLISGLGVLDLWIGISELIHYRDYRD
jgi:hypothetical protein